MRRIAWFSPLPPTDAVTARLSAAVLPHLASSWAVDAFVAGPGEAMPGVDVASAHLFAERHGRAPYDAVVYHVDRNPAAAFAWAHAADVPGLVVFHTMAPHVARFESLRAQDRLDRYRAEFAASYPATRQGTAVPPLDIHHPLVPQAWPLRAPFLAGARAVAVHDAAAADVISVEAPGLPVSIVSLAVAPPDHRVSRAHARTRLGLPHDACVFASLTPFGTPAHDALVSAVVRQMLARHPDAWLVLGTRGDSVRDEGRVRRLNVDTEDARWIVRAAADVGLELEWPGGGEDAPHGHAAWLAAGVPLLALDRPSTLGWPLLNPQSWQPHAVPVPGIAVAPAVGVAVPVDDERHSLGLALERLATDAGLRAALGRAAEGWAAHEASPARAAGLYTAALETMLTARAWTDDDDGSRKAEGQETQTKKGE